MKGTMSWYHIGCCVAAYLSIVKSTPIHQANEPFLLDPRSFIDKEDYSRENEEVLETPEDRDIYQIIIPKKGHSLMYDDVGFANQGDLNAEQVLSLLQPTQVRQQYDYYLPEVYKDHEIDGPFRGQDLLIAKEGTVKRLDDVSGMKDKKDLESLLYQANPALTVQKLPLEPQIDFRKYNINKHQSFDAQKKEDDEEDSSDKKLQLRGMEEEIQPRPSIRRDRAMRGMGLPIYG